MEIIQAEHKKIFKKEDMEVSARWSHREPEPTSSHVHSNPRLHREIHPKEEWRPE